MRKALRNFILGQVIILILMFITNNDFSLLAYVNMSFFVGGIMLFIGLVSYVFSSGFFDIFITTSRKIFTPSHRLDDVESMRAPSQLFTGSVTPLVGGGAMILVVMGIGLLLYYV
ncbi:DUF3899 domain-containing protein [Sporosarcina sp. 179-K 3D1 HS]|uniref:DUF3899 domain-containing protein n=1 Tax=Sporosarcina sp. 179-K 3D1 HS TaxID=3232169 RepID=UPI00399FA189